MKESFNYPAPSQERVKKVIEADAEVKKPSILENLDNQIALFKKLGDVYGQRPELDNFVGAMPESKHAIEYSKESIDCDITIHECTARYEQH